MWRRRSLTTLLGVGLLVVGAAWLKVRTPAGHGWIRNPEADVAYEIGVSLDAATLDLDFRGDERYLLIVGGLGNPDESHRIRLSSEPIAQTTPFCGKPITESAAEILPLAAPPPPAALSGRRGSNTGVRPVRTFHLHVTDGPLSDPRAYVQVEASLVRDGESVRIYLDDRQTPDRLARGLLDQIVELIDGEPVAPLKAELGPVRDVDGDGKFTVLLSPLLQQLQGGRTSLGGFVRGTDFRDDLEAPFSNRADMLYLNSTLQPGDHLRSLVAHEFTHAVCFSRRLDASGGRGPLPEEDDWLNEALAHLSENRYAGGWSNLDYRISRYLTAPQDYPLVVRDYYAAGLWRNHGCRGATYLFLRWCTDRYGKHLPSTLIAAPERGIANVETATRSGFPELFRRWTLALWRSGRDAPADTDGTAFASLDLRGTLGPWSLAGPRTIPWDVESTSKTLDVRGTAAAFLELSTTAPGPRRIHIDAQSGTQLQVTLIRCGGSAAPVRATARWADRQSNSGKLTVQLQAPLPPGYTIERISCEHNVGEEHHSRCFAGPVLEKCLRPAGAEGSPAWLLPVAFPVEERNWCVVKVLVRDRRGGRLSVWAECAPAEPPLVAQHAR